MEEIHSSHRSPSAKEVIHYNYSWHEIEFAFYQFSWYNKQIEARLLKSIARFDQGIATVSKKLRKVKFARENTKSLIEEYEIRLKNEIEDCAGGNKNDFDILC